MPIPDDARHAYIIACNDEGWHPTRFHSIALNYTPTGDCAAFQVLRDGRGSTHQGWTWPGPGPGSPFRCSANDASGTAQRVWNQDIARRACRARFPADLPPGRRYSASGSGVLGTRLSSCRGQALAMTNCDCIKPKHCRRCISSHEDKAQRRRALGSGGDGSLVGRSRLGCCCRCSACC